MKTCWFISLSTRLPNRLSRKKSTISAKDSLDGAVPGKKFRRNIRAYIVPVELHEKCHNAMVAAVLVRQRRFDGGFGLSANFSASSIIFPTASIAAESAVSSSSTSKRKGSPDSSGKLKISSPGVYVKSMRLQFSFIILSSLPLNTGSFEMGDVSSVFFCHRFAPHSSNSPSIIPFRYRPGSAMKSSHLARGWNSSCSMSR